MNRSLSFSFAAGLLAAGALGTATVAEARPDVYFSVGIQSAPVWVQPAPVYLPPRPVYVLPAPVYEHPRWGGYDTRARWERERAWRRAEWSRHQGHEGWRDGDRDHGRRDDDHGRRHIHRD